MKTSRHRPAKGPVPARPQVISWARQHMILAITLPVLFTAVAAGVIVSVSSGGKTGSATPAAVTAPVEAAVTGGAKWLAGPAGKLLAAVNADLGRLNHAERAGRRSAEQSAGGQLATDAKAALAGPMPPTRARIFRSALRDLARAGTQAARGDFTPVGRLLSTGITSISKVTAAADAPANPPAAVTDPRR